MNIIKLLRDKGFDTVPGEFYGHISAWQSWYDGDVKGFHDYRVFTGQNTLSCKRYTMNMGKKVAEDWANLLLNEKVKVTLEGEREQAFFDQVCEDNNFLVKSNEMQELKAALGTAAYVARVEGARQSGPGGPMTGGKLRLDYVTAPCIYPLSWENGRATECAFASTRTQKGVKYLYLQIHRKDRDGTYIIENSLYKDQNGTLSPAELSALKGFENVPEVVRTGSDKPLFVLDRLAIVNNTDPSLPMGIPAFGNAIDQLKSVDISYDSYVNEFVLGKKRVMVQPAALKTLEGEPVFDPNDMAYYVLPEDSQDKNVIQPIDMSLRAADHNAGLQDMLNALSFNCGFGQNHYRFEGGSIATATQVISENSEMFRTIKKHEIILRAVLTDLARIILRLGRDVLGQPLDPDVEISIDFDDSIIESREQEEARIYQMLNAGLMKDDEARSILMNEDIKTARKALPSMEGLTDEPQNETE